MSVQKRNRLTPKKIVKEEVFIKKKKR